jgi:RimJ/RimL family protein N-acetyltransferase
LRPHDIGDFSGYWPMWTQGSPAGIDAPNAQPLGEEETWARLLRFIGHWQAFQFGPFLVIDKTSGSIVGEAGCAFCRRGLGLSFDGAPEAMWRIDRDYQGKGFATEAMRAAIHWLDARQEHARMVCMIDPHNTASQRVAMNLGFREYADTVYRGNPVLLYERIK